MRSFRFSEAQQLSAKGGRAPYPQLVTDDFQRVFRLSISLTTMYCQEMPVITGTFQFTISASNFHGQTRATCTHFAC